MKYINYMLEYIEKTKCPSDKIFSQAVKEVLLSIKPVLENNPKYEKEKILERLLAPERIIKFKITWIDDNNEIQINNGMRVQFNSTLGPYKGGLRFHPSVSEDILKFLAFEQTLKNALTGLPIGGAKGGSDFNPKGKSDREIMKFCYAFMEELYRHIGPETDIPAGDIGVSGKEIGYMFAKYKQIKNSYSNGTLTGKPIDFGGSLLRKEATGYGVVYLLHSLLNDYAENIEGKKVAVSGSGNVAIYTCEKLIQLGAIPITVSDSKGCIYDSRGIDLDSLKEIKENNKESLIKYKEKFPHAQYTPISEYEENSHAVWNCNCDIAIPCATQNELTLNDAKNLYKNNCKIIIEGANMPSTEEAVNFFLKKKDILFVPAKAANAGGVATSQLEMSQNASMLNWTSEKVDLKLKDIMHKIYIDIKNEAEKYDHKGNLVLGANILGFKRVANAKLKQGIF